jgi:hypothetical protein
VALPILTASNCNGQIDSTPNDVVITQFKLCCAAGNLCKHKEVLVNRIDQCAACGVGVHAMCKVELKASKFKSIPSTSPLDMVKKVDHQETLLHMHPHSNVHTNLAFSPQIPPRKKMKCLSLSNLMPLPRLFRKDLLTGVIAKKARIMK